MAQRIRIRRTIGMAPPATLAEGELAVGMANTPPKLWVGTPEGVKQFSSPVQEAPQDGAIYGRQDGSWVHAVGAIVSPTFPANPVPGMLWWNSETGGLYIYYNDGSSSQWIQVNMATPPTSAFIEVSDVPPTSPVAGQLWWENDTGSLFTYYDDGTSAQWVQVK